MSIDVDKETTRERQGRVVRKGKEWEQNVCNYLVKELKNTPIKIYFGDEIQNPKLRDRLSVPLKSSEQKSVWGDIDLVAAIEDFPLAIISCKLSLHGRFTETLFYSTLFRIISHTKVVLATPDVGRGQGGRWDSEWGTAEEPSKDRLLAENYLNGVYVKNLPEFCGNIKSGQSTALGGMVRALDDLPKDLIRWSKDIKRLIRRSKGNLGKFL